LKKTSLTSFKNKIKLHWSLIKSLQTLLLLVTGLAGFMSSRCPWINFPTILGVAGSLFLAISGSTVLNMWYDRDIDSLMKRTCWRPLPSGKISPSEALVFGITLSVLGVGWALAIDLLFGVIVFAGLFFDVVVYTIWLKRRTAWSVVWGGLAGAMPVLAGRALGTGRIEWVGILLALAVLFWIPTHILTFSIRNQEDYERVGVPTFPSTYGVPTTLRVISASSVIAALAMIMAAVGIDITAGQMRLLAVLSGGLLFLAGASMLRPSDKVSFGLFKYASLYMLSAMLLLAAVVF